MCGIVGYVGSNSSTDVLLGGLRRLEYRGYDSAGIAVVDPAGDLTSAKKAGKLQMLIDELDTNPIADGGTGIGHTRWATHGGPTDENAHPHLADDGKLALIHNGIIENFAPLKDELLAEGVVFHSETDSEVAAHLVAREFRETHDLTEAMRRTVARLDGAFTLLVVHSDQPGVVVGARRNSPLVVGLGDGENFMGSDVAAFVAYTQRALSIGQDEIATIRPDGVDVIHFDGTPATPTEFEVNWDASAADKGGWSSFMAKEISEEPEAVAKTILGRVHDGAVTLTDLDPIAERLATVDRVIVIACGTAAYAGILGKYAIEQWARIPVEVELAHEFRYRDPVLDERTLVVVFVSSDEYTRQYDLDILEELRAAVDPARVVAVDAEGLVTAGGRQIAVQGLDALSDSFLAAVYVVVAQILGLSFALAVGTTPDNPFPSGVVNRVVKGVRLHELPAAEGSPA